MKNRPLFSAFSGSNAAIQLLVFLFIALSLLPNVQTAKKRPQKLKPQYSQQAHPVVYTVPPPSTVPPTSPKPQPYQPPPYQVSNSNSKYRQISRCDPGFARNLLLLHNTIRVQHSAPPLLLNSNITYLAQLWSEELATTGFLKHRPNRKMGENLYTARLLRPRKLYPSEPMALWYGERVKYSWYSGEEPDLDSFTSWGHYTAIVWRSSRLVGIGCAIESGRHKNAIIKTVYVTVNFYPKGNVVGHFSDNVLPAKGETWAYEGKGASKRTTAKPTTITTTTTTKQTTVYSPPPTTATESYITTTTVGEEEETSPYTAAEETTTTNKYTEPTTTQKPEPSLNSYSNPPPPPLPSCNHSQHYSGQHQGYPYQMVPPLQPPPPPPPSSLANFYPIDFTDPDDFEDFLKFNAKSSRKDSIENSAESSSSKDLKTV